MKKLIIILAAVLSLTGITSCKKALTEQLHSALAPNNFYQTANDAEAALNGVFSTLQVQTYYQRTVYLINELSGDVFQPNNASSDRQELYTGTYSPNNGQIDDWWQNSYILIKDANDVITYVPAINMDTAERNNVLGNAYFLRGMAYFDLVRTFGDVPLVLNGNTQDLFPSRTSADSVYDQVIKDLQFAETNCLHAAALPSSEMGRITSEAASSMLARVYLQRASTSFAVPADNQSALDECNKVIAYSAGNPAAISLSPNYQDIFGVTTKNGPESIFAVQFGAPPNSVNITNLMFDPADSGGYASFLPLGSFTNSFNVNDIRKQTNVGTNDNGIPYISKYRDPTVSAGSFGGNNWIVLRFADVLLMQSEAMNNINTSDPGKFNGINLVRTRAGLGSSLLSFTNTASPDDFINALVNERLWELGMEGHRRNDLIRLGKFQQVKALEGFPIDNNHLLMPIPQVEMDVNANLRQNQGY